MNIKATIDLSGFDFNVSDINDIVTRELESTASKIEELSKDNCPVDTGFLRDSIEAEVNGLEANIGTDCDYAERIHDGSYNMPARPFLESAANVELEGIENRIADAIERLL